MELKESLAILLTIVCLTTPTSTALPTDSGTVYMSVLSYEQTNREGCDFSTKFKRDYCDPYFIISVSSSTTSLGTFTSTVHDNADSVLNFGSKIGQLPNPVPFHFTESFFQSNDRLVISITVKDKDVLRAQHMTDFKYELNITDVTLFANNSEDTSSIHFIELEGMPAGHKLRMAVWMTCRQNYYNTGCSVHCNPGRFSCSPSGELICPADYMAFNDSCHPKDECLMKGPSYCLNGGTCMKTLSGEAACECAMNFTGSRCELATHPCHRNVTWCSRGVCRVRNDSDSVVCVCHDGFTGFHCDQDVNECDKIKGICGVGGACVNQIGSFECVCRPGFSGDLCRQRLPVSTAAAKILFAPEASSSASSETAGSDVTTQPSATSDAKSVSEAATSAEFKPSQPSIQSTAGSPAEAGTIFIMLEDYEQQDREKCDISNRLRKNYCDPYFMITVSTSSQQIGSYKSTEYDNAASRFYFGNKIGQLPNPLPIRFTESQFRSNDSLIIFITVIDKDSFTKDEHMTSFRLELNISDVTLFANNSMNRSSIEIVELTGIPAGHKLRMAVWMTCRQNYYNTGCSARCETNGITGSCSANGELVCDDGFTGPRCGQDADECTLVKGICGIGGDGVNQVGSFNCVCRPGFSGDLCRVRLPLGPVASAAPTTATSTVEMVSDAAKAASQAGDSKPGYPTTPDPEEFTT